MSFENVFTRPHKHYRHFIALLDNKNISFLSIIEIDIGYYKMFYNLTLRENNVFLNHVHMNNFTASSKIRNLDPWFTRTVL